LANVALVARNLSVVVAFLLTSQALGYILSSSGGDEADRRTKDTTMTSHDADFDETFREQYALSIVVVLVVVAFAYGYVMFAAEMAAKLTSAL
jgi:hypothetical protein